MRNPHLVVGKTYVMEFTYAKPVVLLLEINKPPFAIAVHAGIDLQYLTVLVLSKDESAMGNEGEAVKCFDTVKMSEI